MDEIHVQISKDSEQLAAEYLAEFSNPRADIAVLRLHGVDAPPVQLGRMREGTEALGFGFRPTALAAEKAGHSFSGKLGPGQDLELAPPPSMKARLAEDSLRQERPWNKLPDKFRLGQVRNFYAHGLLEQGISGGAIYDPDLRRVVGLFRAIEGEGTAYVIPIDDVFVNWGALEEANRTEVAEPLLEKLLVTHRLALVREGARPIVPLASATFERFLKDYWRFGGRGREDEKLSAFLKERDRGYCFITGLAGFGKTALLAHWAGTLSKSSDSLVYHFISPLVAGTTDEANCLQALCDQLVAIHGLGGDIPVDPRRLRPLYADLLRLSSPRNRIIVLLDGLDEALGEWTPDSSLFPQDLGEGVYVVFSARQMADREWLDTLGLDAENVRTMELGKLSLDEITDVVVQTGLLAADAETLPAIGERLLSLTEGDPFYLQDLVKDMEKNGANLESLKDYEVGHINYLNSWWKAAARRHPGEGFIDLMGTLAALRAPLGRTGLIRISDDDQLTGANIDLLLEDAARYIQGKKDEGYLLKHSRIRKFIRETLDRDFVKYTKRVADFCLHWNRDDASDQERLYILLHAVPHLIEADRTADAIALLTPEWLSEKWKRLNSYLSFIRDLDLLLEKVAQSEDLELLSQFSALTIARQTAREIMGNFPNTLLTAWVRLGGIEHVADVLGSLNEYRGQAAEPLVAVAQELLSQEYLAEPATDTVAACELASRQLERAIAMLPLVRTAIWKLDRLTNITKLLRTAPFNKDQREPLIARTLSFAESQKDLTLRAHALALMTQVLAAFPEHEAKASELVATVKALTEGLELEADRLCVGILLLPALGKLEPARVEEFARSILESIKIKRGRGSLGMDPTIEVLAYFTQPEHRADWLPEVLEKMVRSTLDSSLEYIPHYELLRALCLVGQSDKAVQFLDEIWNRKSESGAYCFMDLSETLAESSPEHGDPLLARAKQYIDDGQLTTPNEQATFPIRLAGAFWSFGRWDEGLAMLASVEEPDEDALIDCIRIAATAKGRDVPSLVAGIVARAEPLEKTKRAEVIAKAAHALIGSDRNQARGYLEGAIRSCLGELPEGDLDRLRFLEAVVRMRAGDIEGASATADNCTWQHRRVVTHAALLKTVIEPETLTRFTRKLINHIDDINEDTFMREVVKSSCDAATYLAPLDSELSNSLCDSVKEMHERVWGRDQPFLMSSLTKARALFDKDLAHEQWVEFCLWYAAALEPKESKGLFHALEDLGETFPETVFQQLQQYHRLVDAIAEPEDRFIAEAVYVSALGAAKRAEALTSAAALVASLDSLAASPPAINVFQRMIQELTGSWAGEFSKRPDFVEQATLAVINALPFNAARCEQLLDSIVDYSLAAEGAGVQSKALEKFFSCLANAPANVQPQLAAICDKTMDRVVASLEAQLADDLVLLVVRSFSEAGQFDRAELLVSRIQSAEERPSAAKQVESDRAYAQLDLTNPVDAAYVDAPERTRPVTLAFLKEIRVERNTRECLEFGLDSIANKDSVFTRSDLLEDFIPLLVLPLHELGGAPVVSKMVSGIEDFDSRLVRTAALIAASV
jgi:hypothetical protein